jgi:DNA damage-binding protein 1
LQNDDLSLEHHTSISLGTTPLKLSTFLSNGSRLVFCSSDRPTVIYSRSDKLTYSNVNLRQVSCVCPFNSNVSENGLAIATDGQLKIGVVETVQKLHIKSIHIGETVRRIHYHQTSESFGIISSRQVTKANGEIEELSSFKLLDGKTFESIFCLI